MAILTYDAWSGGYWLANSLIKCHVKPNSIIANLTELTLPRDVAFAYLNLNYWTEGGVNGSFYLNTLGAFTLAPSASPLATVSLTLTKTYADANGITHDLTITVSLADGKSHADIYFKDVASVGLKKINLLVESNMYPQGYALQASGGNFSAGGSTTYTSPAPYDNSVYSFFAKGLIQKDGVDQATVALIDGYVACYSADASVGIFSRYISHEKSRVYTLNTGTDRQYAWLHVLPDALTKFTHEATYHFGAWAVGAASSCAAAYNALPLVEVLLAAPAAQYNKVVRTDLNADLYDYNPKFHAILGDITAHAGNATMVPAGTVSFKFFKHRSNATTWNATVKDLGEDYVQKSITMARQVGHRLFVEIDVLDGTWNTANPADRAIGVDEVTPAMSGDGNYYWVKMTELITPGKAYHDAFVAGVVYLCQNYNFYGLVISECFYKHVDYSADSKALFLADNPSYTDWPRKADGGINIYNETLGKWKTQKLGTLWSELQAIANANNKKFFVMVEPNFESEASQAWEFGHYYPEAITHCDGLWVWGYYGNFGVPAEKLKNIFNKLHALEQTYPSKENIISIGLWGAGASEVISASELKLGLDILTDSGWPVYGDGIEITPSKHMTSSHWSVLWGSPISLYFKERAAASRIVQTLVVMTFDYCGRTFGTNPCLATGEPCYNTRSTCKYLSAWQNVTKDYKFSRKDKPLVGDYIRPYITRHDEIGTEIDPSRGVAVNARVTLEFADDERETDVGIDPYVGQRSSVQGTFWKKFFARNKYYQGRPVVIKKGFAGLAEADYQVAFKGIIDSISEISATSIKIIVKDYLKKADSVEVPAPSKGKLTDAPLTSGSATVNLDDASGYDASGWVRIDDEIIAYSGKSGNQLTGCTRGAFSTTAAEHSSDTKVQQCAVWQNQNVWDIIYSILTERVGFIVGEIDVATAEAERDIWLVDYAFTGVVSEPKKAIALIEELCDQSNSNVWWDNEAQLVRFKVTAPALPGQTVKTIGLSGSVAAGTGKLIPNEKTRISSIGINYNKRAVGKDSERGSYKNGIVDVSDSVGSDKHKDSAPKTINSRWLTQELIASIVARRKLSRFADPPALFDFILEMKDDDLKTGDLCNITSRQMVDIHGAPEERIFQVLKKEPEGNKIKCRAMYTNFAKRYAIIGAASLPDYPLATVAQKKYGYIGDNNGMVNGGKEEGFRIW